MFTTHSTTTWVRNAVIGLALAYAAILLLGPTLLRSAEFLDTDSLPGEIKEDVCERFSSFSCTDSDSDSDTGYNNGSSDDDGDGGEDDAGDGDSDGNDGGGSGGSGSVDPDAINLTVRTQAGIVVSDALDEPSRFAGDVAVSPDNGGDDVDIEAASALALLLELDESSDEFEISDLQYFESFESFFLNCIDIEAEGELCGSWQYVVNGEYPSIGLDKYLLEEGDQLYLFFGAPRTVQAPTTVNVDIPFTATSVAYDPEKGVYEPVSGYTIGLLQENPDDPWNPIELETKSVADDGTATFTITETGEYLLGLAEDFYFPTVPITVSTHNGGGGGTVLETNEARDTFDVPEALSFIGTLEEANGSYGAALYTDWTTLALVAGGADTEALRTYLTNADTDGFSVTDHERRAMALMALDVSPFNGTETDHITAIRAEFGGVQIGDPDAVNDDIFGLIVLTAAGADEDDEVIDAVIQHLLGSQDAGGRWGGDIDLTAAGVQALAPYTHVSDVETALVKARAYLLVQQNEDGGWGSSFGDTNVSNPFTTSWVLQALYALEEDADEWEQDGNTPLTYLAHAQEADGGVAGDTDKDRLWATSYAVPAVLGLTWYDLVDTYEEPASTSGGAEAATSNTTTTEHSTTQPEAPVQSTNIVGASDNAESVANTPSNVGYEATRAAEDKQEIVSETSTSSAQNNEPETAGTSTRDQLAAAGEAGELFTEETLRIVLLVIALLLIGFGVMQWRKA